jgi:hypothetical protein
MMLAEKAADLILGVDPLPAENAPYYRHGQDDLNPPQTHDSATNLDA